MKATLYDLAGELRRRARALQDHYDAEELHQLRVGLRRMRGLLKAAKGKKARDLRHELSTMAATTSAARDWDTLLARAYADLGPRQVKLFETELRRREAASHQPVLQMLKSPGWTGALERWDKYLGKHHAREHGTGNAGKSIARARTRVGRAWLRANQVGRPRDWHELRIAIKNLRYRLEERPGKLDNDNSLELLEQCKQLQSFLGDWHDTVVHLQLIRELARDYDPGPATRELKVLGNWCRKLESEGRRCLEATRAHLEPGANAILPDQGQTPGK